jgi:hypothetical protein
MTVVGVAVLGAAALWSENVRGCVTEVSIEAVSGFGELSYLDLLGENPNGLESSSDFSLWVDFSDVTGDFVALRIFSDEVNGALLSLALESSFLTGGVIVHSNGEGDLAGTYAWPPLRAACSNRLSPISCWAA